MFQGNNKYTFKFFDIINPKNDSISTLINVEFIKHYTFMNHGELIYFFDKIVYENRRGRSYPVGGRFYSVAKNNRDKTSLFKSFKK